MKNGISYADLKLMTEKEVIEFFTLIAEYSAYEQERIELLKGG